MHALAILTAVLYLVSWVFPTAAGLSHNTGAFPSWWGPVDVTLAFLIALLVLLLSYLTQGKVSPYATEWTNRTYRILIHGILFFLIVFFLAGDRIVWRNCLTGFAWRTWLLLYGLPAWFTLIESKPVSEPRA